MDIIDEIIGTAIGIFIISIIGGIILYICEIKYNLHQIEKKQQNEKEYTPKLKPVEGKTYSYEIGSKTHGFNGWEKKKVVDAGKIQRYFTPVYRYKVHGINPKTNRKKSAVVVLNNPDSQLETERKSGLVNITSKEKLFDPPTEKQINYARDLGIPLSDDMEKADLSCVLSRYLDVDSSDKCENTEDPPKIIWDKLINCNEWCSAYTSELGLVTQYFFNCLDEKEKITFYLATMYCKHHNITSYDIWSLPVYNTLCEAAEILQKDESFCNSLKRNVLGEDIILSNYFISRQSKAGKMAWNVLKQKGLVSGEPRKRNYYL